MGASEKHEAAHHGGADDPLRVSIGAVLFNARNFPEPVQARLLGQDMAPLNAKLTGAVLGSRWLSDVRATAWDQGVTARAEDSTIRRATSETYARNPYRHNGFDHCPGCQAAHQGRTTFEDRLADAIRRDQETGALPKPTEPEATYHGNGSHA